MTTAARGASRCPPHLPASGLPAACLLPGDEGGRLSLVGQTRAEPLNGAGLGPSARGAEPGSLCGPHARPGRLRRRTCFPRQSRSRSRPARGRLPPLPASALLPGPSLTHLPILEKTQTSWGLRAWLFDFWFGFFFL